MDRRSFLSGLSAGLAALLFGGEIAHAKPTKKTQQAVTWYGWGGNVQGTAGLGDLVHHSDGPVLQPAGIDFTQVSAGGPHVAAIDRAGNLYVWGQNNFYRLGTGENPFTTIHSSPFLITQSGLSNIVEVACTQRGTFARRGDGVVFFAGNNDNGQVGEGAVGFDFGLAPQPDLYPTFTALTAWSALPVVQMIPGYAAIAMRTSDGKLYFAGANNGGEAGNGGATGTNVTAPTQWGTLTDIAQASLSANNMIVLRSNTEVWGSGDNDSGCLMDGTSTPRLSPVLSSTAPGSPRTVAILDSTTFVIDTSSRLWAAGYNGDGQVTNDGTTDFIAHTSPTQITIGSKTFVKVVGAASAVDNYAVITTDGLLYALGGNTLTDGRPIDSSGLNLRVYTQVWPDVPIGRVTDAVSPGSGEGTFLAQTLSPARTFVWITP